MISPRTLALAAPLAGVLAAGALTGSASAATAQTLGCRASVARVSALSGGLVVEPYVANSGGAPCASDTAGLSATQGLNLGGLTNALGGTLQVGPAQASTTSTDTGSSLGAAASTTVSALSIPTPAGAISLVAPVQATAGYECVDGAVQANAASTLSVIRIGSQQIALGGPGQPDTIPLYGPANALGQTPAIGSVSVNQNVSTATSNTETLLEVQVGGVVDAVVGQATVSQPASGACAGVPGGGTPFPDPYPTSPPPTSGPAPAPTGTTPGGGVGVTTLGCPLGTFRDGGACVIGTAGGVAVVDSAGSGDVTGARVITLADARRHYRSACLRGAGPKFVVVGTNRANRITVRKRRFRVLGLGGNDRITVSGGSRTCVDGGSGNDRIVNLKSNRVSIYGGAGNDTIRVGNGPALISGGRGNDRITAGRGRVTIQAGRGRNRITARGRRDRVSASGGRTVARLVRSAMPFAHRHGIRRVLVLR